jgi:hypothetical protein
MPAASASTRREAVSRARRGGTRQPRLSGAVPVPAHPRSPMAFKIHASNRLAALKALSKNLLSEKQINDLQARAAEDSPPTAF